MPSELYILLVNRGNTAAATDLHTVEAAKALAAYPKYVSTM